MRLRIASHSGICSSSGLEEKPSSVRLLGKRSSRLFGAGLGLGGRRGRRAAGSPGGGFPRGPRSRLPCPRRDHSVSPPPPVLPPPLSLRGLSAGAAAMAYCRQEGRQGGLPWRPAYEGLQGTCGFATPGTLRPRCPGGTAGAAQGTFFGTLGRAGQWGRHVRFADEKAETGTDEAGPRSL